MAGLVGNGVVDVSEWDLGTELGFEGGSGTADGSAKSLELRSKLAAGDRRTEVIAGLSTLSVMEGRTTDLLRAP